MVGTLPKAWRTLPNCWYSGRKSWPQAEMQCASSIASTQTACLRKERAAHSACKRLILGLLLVLYADNGKERGNYDDGL